MIFKIITDNTLRVIDLSNLHSLEDPFHLNLHYNPLLNYYILISIVKSHYKHSDRDIMPLFTPIIDSYEFINRFFIMLKVYSQKF